MNYRIIPVTPFQQNCSLIWCETTQRAALVDPGGDAGRLLQAVEQAGLALERLLLTHGHLDHVGAAVEIARRTGVPIEGPQEADRFWLERLPEQAEMFGFPHLEPFTPDRWLEAGETVTVGEQSLTVHHTPGHTPGHIAFHHTPSKTLFVGDVLFRGSIGRTDFPRGDYATLIASIRALFELGDDTTFVPGHGPTGTLGVERRTNPFLA